VSVGFAASDRPLAARYDVALLDLDGVVYVGPAVVPHAADALAEARRQGMRTAFVTNNASRRPQAVADHLRELGVGAAAEDVVTSAQAAARLLREQLPPGARVLVVGTDALADEVGRVGLVPVGAAPRGQVPVADAVVQGYDPGLVTELLAQAVAVVRGGALFVASNRDLTVPSSRGRLPGNGAYVRVVAETSGREPLVAGKPETTLHAESVERTGAHHPLVVGDRLDTDIEGAVRAGTDALLVLTGITDPADLLWAPPSHRPTYVAPDLRGLLRAHPATEVAGDGVACRAAHARWTGEALEVSGDPGDDGLDGVRAAATLSWVLADRGQPTGAPAHGGAWPAARRHAG
jgi:glycerol-1-phosphatase